MIISNKTHPPSPSIINIGEKFQWQPVVLNMLLSLINAYWLIDSVDQFCRLSLTSIVNRQCILPVALNVYRALVVIKKWPSSTSYYWKCTMGKWRWSSCGCIPEQVEAHLKVRVLELWCDESIYINIYFIYEVYIYCIYKVYIHIFFINKVYTYMYIFIYTIYIDVQWYGMFVRSSFYLLSTTSYFCKISSKYGP